MYIKIRNLAAKPGEDDLILTLSRTTKIQEIHSMISKQLNVGTQRQRLFYKGKLLVDEHVLFEYGVQLNDVIQLMITNNSETGDVTSDQRKKVETQLEHIDGESKFYKIGDHIDMQDIHGAWFEAIIERIIVNNSIKTDANIPSQEPELIFKCLQRNVGYPVRIDCDFDSVRPRPYHIYNLNELRPGMTVLVNYNIDAPRKRGYWYDFQVSVVLQRSIKGTIILKSKILLKNITIHLIDEIYRLEKPVENVSKNDEQHLSSIPPRKIPFNCTNCNDDIAKKCKDCGCQICHSKNNVELMILCDECDDSFHMGCLNPPILELPEADEWYCPACKVDDSEIVKAGDKLKPNRRTLKLSKTSSTSTRDWGKGFACMGRTKECTIAKKDHLGPLPGIEVGTCWLYRQQVSEAGVHRPLVAGIHGSEKHFAYSIVLSGGYEDDIDNGDEFYYTGSGGRDLSGNKRVSEQSCDQKLTRMNKALAMNCDAVFNDQIGAEAKDWRRGQPIRVVRNYKAGKHSKYAPNEGNRYDGIYKVVKYYPEKGISGFVIWRYLLRRDDDAPAPWHDNGKEFDIIYPDGFQQVLALKMKKNVSKKRVLREVAKLTASKKRRIDEYILPDEMSRCISLDTLNEKLWKDCMQSAKDGKRAFYEKVQEMFICICCQDLVNSPVTTPCKHNICKQCLKRSFASELYNCPYCRCDLGSDYVAKINENLRTALNILLPHYENVST